MERFSLASTSDEKKKRSSDCPFRGERSPLIATPKPSMDPSIKETSLKRKVAILIQQNALILAIMVAIIGGFSLGVGLREAHPSPDVLMWLGLPGELFLNCLKATIVPLLVCMVITVTSQLEPKNNGKIAAVATLLFYLTSVAAVLVAIVMFFIFKPEEGALSGGKSQKEASTDLQTQDVFADLIRNLFPDNVISATFQQRTTEYARETQQVLNTTDNSTIDIVVNVRSGTTASGINILGLITICTAVGIAANKALPKDSVFLGFFKQGQEVVFVIIRWLFWTTPLGVASLIAKSVAGVENLGAVFYSLGLLVAAVVVGLLIHQLIVLPAAIFIFVRKNPYTFLVKCLRPFFVAFAATATSVALPEMLTSCQANQVDPFVSSFVVSMSITLQADGSSLFMASASLFLAQTSGKGMDLSSYFIIGFLASVLGMAIPPVPSSSIVNIIIILSSANFPLQDVALLFAMEWFLDRCRSGVNAVSHVVCAAITDAICTSDDSKGQGQNSVVEVLHTGNDVSKIAALETVEHSDVPVSELYLQDSSNFPTEQTGDSVKYTDEITAM